MIDLRGGTMRFQNNISAIRGLRALYFWMLTFDEGEDNELILNPRCIYIEMEEYLLEISDFEGKIKIELKKQIECFSDIDTTYKIDVRSFVLDYPEATYFINKIGGINVEVSEEMTICDAIEIWLHTENYGEQVLFIHSGLFGIRFRESKSIWQKNWYTPIYGNQLREHWFI